MNRNSHEDSGKGIETRERENGTSEINVRWKISLLKKKLIILSQIMIFFVARGNLHTLFCMYRFVLEYSLHVFTRKRYITHKFTRMYLQIYIMGRVINEFNLTFSKIHITFAIILPNNSGNIAPKVNQIARVKSRWCIAIHPIFRQRTEIVFPRSYARYDFRREHYKKKLSSQTSQLSRDSMKIQVCRMINSRDAIAHYFSSKAGSFPWISR